MKISLTIGKINYVLGLVSSILIFLVIPRELSDLWMLPICSSIMINLAYLVFNHIPIDRTFVLIICIIAYSLILVVTSEYTQNYIIRGWLSILLMYLFYTNGVERISRMGDGILWVMIDILLIYRTIVSERMADGSLIFHTAFFDRIETECIIILFMFLGIKTKHYFCIVYTVWYLVTISTSRGSLMLFGLFFIVRYIKKAIPWFISKVVNIFRRPRILFYVFGCLLFVFIAFCYYWVNGVGVRNLTEYRASIFDTSNFARFSSSVYAVEVLLKNNNLLFSGFGTDLKEYMGLNGGQRLFMGHALVQTHNSFLSLLLCYGIIPGAIYIAILCHIVRKYFTNDNLEYIIGFVIYTFIIVLLGKRNYDLFWVFILMTPVQNDVEEIEEALAIE